MNFLEILVTVLSILLIFNIILAIIVVFFERRNPVSTWAWLMVLLFIPVIGFIIYLFFGQDGRKQKVFIKKCENDDNIFNIYLQKNKNIKDEINKQKSSFQLNKSLIKSSYEMRNYEDLANMNLTANNVYVTYNNEIKLLHDGIYKFESLIEDIRNAKNYIHIEYYIVRDDKIGRQLIYELTKKAKEGIEVKFICDGMGGRGLHRNFFKEFLDAGGQVGIFLKPLAGKLNVRVNYRDHRKIAVIDGKVGYTGGFNIGAEYLGLSQKFGYWRDTHIRIEGDAIDQLELRFIMDWYFASNENLSSNITYFPQRNNIKGASVQIVSSGPDCKYHQIKNSYFKLINEAEKSIYIATPYFIPDDSILEAIKIAALSGIDVKVLIPGKPDHPFVYWANLSYSGELLNSGVKFYQYDKNSFIHSKLIMVDSLVCSIGTANMDVRSFNVNFEVNAIIYDKEITEELEKEFLNDLKKSVEITSESYNKRSLKVKIHEAVSRLISPML